MLYILGERIKKLLIARKISRSQLAGMLGISVARMNHYINGRYQPGGDLLAEMSRHLSTTVDYLLGRVEFSSSLQHSRRMDSIVQGDVLDFGDLDSWTFEIMIYGTSGPAGAPPVSSLTIVDSGLPIFPKGYILLMEDDSMEPFFKKGDVVGVPSLRIDPYMANGDAYYVVKTPGDNVGRLIRKAHVDGDVIVFSALNSAYPPVVCDLRRNRYDIIVGYTNSISRALT